MKIIVLIKQVPGTSGARMDPETGVMIRDAAETMLNPLDEHAVAEALKIKEKNPGTEIIALTMGPPSAQKVLQEACARGADNGILLSDRAFGGSDTLATSRVLAAAARKIGAFDLILGGEKATDGETGQTGPMTATLLDLPVVTFVRRLTVEDGFITAQRMVEEGFEDIQVRLPALVTVVRDINNPPLPSLRRYIMAKKISFPVWGPEDINMEASEAGLKGSATRVVKIFSPRLSRNTTLYTADTQDNVSVAVNVIMTALNERSLIRKGESHGI